MGITNVGNGVWSLNVQSGGESPTDAGGGYLRQAVADLINADRVTPDQNASIVRLPKEPLHVHLKWQYNGYLLYTEYYFEAWTTEGAEGPQYPVNSLVLRWRHGSVTGEEAGVNTSMVSKSDRTYNLGTDTDICGIAIARADGWEPWGVSSPTGCTWRG